ncbi:MAG TPA: hypothetical protein DF296_09900 [Candidatus Margulisbacteria bacterium]|nr:MAG: hypothetical protein A2X42_08835 [Candidatus Margulisbacteria bacterium GWF2_38_17]OGI07548.1 MAG: hypothetical protein A2X41_08740 [Candidatus Margulisbacteria bacterium GWE2_39_32]HCT85499.1 hypothetical protein [Candidatus Margulisiibacteriota bacterium]
MGSPMDIIKKKREEADRRIREHRSGISKRVYVGMATCEIAAGSEDVMQVFKTAINKGLPAVQLSQKGCVGRCNLEPTVEVLEEGKLSVKYCKVDPDKARQIIERHLKNGEVIKEWVLQ